VGGAQGDKGTVYLRDGGSSAVRIFHGFTFADFDHEESSWISDASATNQYCDPLLAVDATPQIRAASISIGGAIDCAPEVTSFAIVQEGVGSGLAILDGASLSVNGALRLETLLSLSVGNGASIANTKRATNLEIVIADGDDQSWDAVTIDGAKEGRVIIDAAIALALTNSTTVTGSPLWPSLNSLAIDATSQIDASGKGCDSSSFSAGNGAGPDDSNVCVQSGAGAGGGGNDFGGAGGGAHGGAGAAGDVGAGGTPYDTAVAPVRLGASGGNTAGGGGGPGGTGGGAVEIAAQSITHDGIIRANGGLGGGSGGRVAGGGSGGAIFLSTPSLTITSGTFEAKGGDAPGTAGGGGGGRIALVYESGTFDADASDFDVAGGVGVRNGDNGTVYVEESTASIVRVFHGFTFEDVDYQASTWISDSTATNQICAPTLASDATPSITAESIMLAGTIDCAPAIESFEVVQAGSSGALEIGTDASISVNGALRLDAETDLNVGDGVSIVNTKLGADLTLGIPDGDDQSWSGVTIDGAREGRIVLDAAIALSLANGTTVSGNPAWPALTALSIDATSAIDADEKGCDSRIEVFGGGSGSAPDCSNVCKQSQKGAGLGGNDFGGAGGGGHGGAGGRGDVGAGGSAYEARKAPRLVGASGGNTGGGGGGGGGAGGGVIEIIVNGTLSNDGVVTARGGLGGGSGGRVAGGGSGGTIIISADEYTCTSGSTFAADGGDGAIGTAGGGGGGRVAVIAAVDSCVNSPLANLDPALVAPGGASGGAGSAADGTSGSVFTTASPSLCGDPVAPIVASRSKRAVGRSVTASDALFTLNVAVGSDCCDPCLCDVNGSGDVTATDALAGLNAAVGQPVDLLCPPCF
ncbi:MAG TPA: hypothetical protein VFO62_01555, partial [Candidatus Binatia bacterium]|nr:hypothetical protein [Candidatus Binatia bacterium]